MNVETIRIPRQEAKRLLASYEKGLLRRQDPEWEAARDALRAAVKGLPLISLSKVIGAAGWNEKGQPKLAIGKADRSSVRAYVGWESGSQVVKFLANPWPSRGRLPHDIDTYERLIPLSSFPPRPRVNFIENGQSRWRFEWDGDGIRAMMPMVPPQHQPGNVALRDCFILWEAVWTPSPPVDPILLKHVGGDLYSILASWDLTPIEQAIIAQTRRAL